MLIHIVDPTDIRVRDPACQLKLPGEALYRDLVGCEAGAKGFQGDSFIMQHEVCSFVDLAHAALSEQADDPKSFEHDLTVRECSSRGGTVRHHGQQIGKSLKQLQSRSVVVDKLFDLGAKCRIVGAGVTGQSCSLGSVKLM